MYAPLRFGVLFRQSAEAAMSFASNQVEPMTRESIDRTLSEIDADASPGVLDCRATLERLDGDVELFRDLLGFYFRDVPELMAEMGRAVTAGDADSLGRWTHRLKGLVSNFDAQHATQSAYELELMGRNGQLDQAPAVYRRLEIELAELTCQLRRF